jgi:hypothetical protein
MLQNILFVSSPSADLVDMAELGETISGQLAQRRVLDLELMEPTSVLECFRLQGTNPFECQEIQPIDAGQGTRLQLKAAVLDEQFPQILGISAREGIVCVCRHLSFCPNWIVRKKLWSFPL